MRAIVLETALSAIATSLPGHRYATSLMPIASDEPCRGCRNGIATAQESGSQVRTHSQTTKEQKTSDRMAPPIATSQSHFGLLLRRMK